MRSPPAAQLRLYSPLAQQSRVIEPLVSIGQTLEDALHLAIAVPGPARELIRYRQAQGPQTQRVLRVRRQHIPANRLRFLRLIQVPIQLRLGNRLRNPRLRNRLQLNIHKNLASQRHPSTSPPLVSSAPSTSADRKTHPPPAPSTE